VVLSTLTLASAGCSDQGRATVGPDEFLGPHFHFVLAGFVNQQEIDIDLPPEVAGDAAQAMCERQYVVPDVDDPGTWADGGSMREIEITAFVEVEGVPLMMQFELKEHDFQSDPDGTVVDVVPRSDLVDAQPHEMWIELEFEDLEGNRLYEQSAQVGTFVRGAHTGEPGPDGLVIPAGVGGFGGWFEARWSVTEELRGSFFVSCPLVDVEDS
jgi:hypothetical protein